MASKGLKTFAKNECANYWPRENGCIFDKPCSVMNDEPCRYFEKAVLGPPDYKFQLPKYDYSALFKQYAKINLNYNGFEVNVRRCGCGEILRPRHKYCDKCSRKRARTANRQRQQKHYDSQLST